MHFKYYSNAISQASKNVAAGVFIVGMLLIGFGFLIFVLRYFFAVLFALLFCIAGIGCFATAIKIFWSLGRTKRTSQTPPEDYRENVRIYTDTHFEQ